MFPALNSEKRSRKAAQSISAAAMSALNYAYALEQLEAAFYTQVVATPYQGMSGYERSVLHDIRDH